MSSISQFLPDPKHSAPRRQQAKNTELPVESALVATNMSHIPPYGKRKGWVPKTAQDFGDGGAYPEVHILQYPRGLGLKKEQKGNALAKQIDGDGNISYDALAQYGRRSNEVVHSQFKDIVPLRQRRDFDENQDAIPERPDMQLVKETAERTKLALEKTLGGRIDGTMAKGVKSAASKEPTYVRYTPGQQGAEFNSGARQRIVRVTDMPVDPMEPSKVRLQKKARAPAEPPAPVMHSPPRKITADEQKEWSIPPCVSNWKNIHGFTVSLDKRLATEGRGMDEISVNDNFAKLSEALISAESHARTEISERAKIQQALAQREKETKEERLRLLAQRAREERAAASASAATRDDSYAASTPVVSTTPEQPSAHERASEEEPGLQRRRDPSRRTAADYFTDNGRESRRSGRSRSPSPSRRHGKPDETGERERDELRRERKKQHERDLRLSRMGSDAKAKYLRKTETRDISEKIALGIAKPTGPKEGLFDSRLFNQPSASNTSLQNDEAYNLYDKPLFNTAGRSSNYRPRGNADEENGQDIERLMESDRFGNALGGSKGAQPSGGQKQQRSGPVEFEKGDVFGIGEFVDSTKKRAKQ
ncbi:mRNA splicing protein [Coemansia sp. RSA 1813]|nr:mRNA splicing protein [Coemansia sp. RSA 1646]KAJ1770064.1 mRNA splicing protein [Coemansia sp. RSA 1843]KAJ2087434.1 mRNA splicing protein [Coemansia sp. RSA 986]KAJ2212425.1 mRNA splicing protein [Coemansia sp. RSA 487]KAJ2566406.1 mRNA splicing protein [Coemansia sp. RSA 1813]